MNSYPTQHLVLIDALSFFQCSTRSVRARSEWLEAVTQIHQSQHNKEWEIISPVIACMHMYQF